MPMPVALDMPVLVVDDYKTMVRILNNLLRSLGFTNIHEAASGEEAFKLAKENRYGLVVSDWFMEPMSGLDLLQAIRGDEELKETPFIMVTAEGKTENVVAAKRAGVDNYIVKPFNAHTLRQKITSVLGEFETAEGRP
jgi:two-component system chemotaxis response regulator CheY